MANLKCYIPIMVNEAVYAMQIATGLKLPRGCPLGKGRGVLERVMEKKWIWYYCFFPNRET